MNWRFPSGHLGRCGASRLSSRNGAVLGGMIVAGLLVQGGGMAFAAEQQPTASRPALGKNADGYLEVFKVEADGELLHRWQKRASGDWSSWTSLGGAALPGVAVVTNGDGRMAVFAVDRASQTLRYVQQESTNSVEWSGWKNLGGAMRATITVGQNADGMLEVFALEAGGNRVKHLRQTNALDGWSSWEDLGGHVESQLVVARNRDGRLELFGLEAGSHQLVHRWQIRPGGNPDWSEWVGLGGAIEPGFALGRNVLGLLEVFAVARTNNGVVRIRQIAPGESLKWAAWEDFGGQSPIGPPERASPSRPDAPQASQSSPGVTTSLGTNNAAQPRTRSGSADAVRPVVSGVKPDLTVAQSADGRLEVYAVEAEELTLLHRWETMTDGSDRWSAWASMGSSTPSCPAVGQNEDGNQEVFALEAGEGHRINHRRQISRASDWLDWSNLDHPTFDYNTRTWQTDEGLPDNVVEAITQTQDGYLWVGTRAGLARFDGVDFTCFDTNNTPALQCASITALCRDRNGRLWIGTDGGGVARLDGRAFSHYGKTNGLAGDTIRVICERKDGAVWIGTTTGLTRYENEQCRNYTKEQGLLSDTVTSLYEDVDRNLWIATGEGLNRLQGERMVSFAMPNRLPGDSVRGICQDKGGRIWIGSNNGMLWYSWYWTNFYAYNSRYGLSDMFVSTICEDREADLNAGVINLGNAFTLSAWANLAANAFDIQTIWANQPAGYGSPGFAWFANTYKTSDQKLDFASGDGVNGNESKTAAGAVSFGQWHLLTASVNRTKGSVEFYVDGADLGGSSSVVTSFPSQAPVNLGRFTNSAFYCNGILDEARIGVGACSSNWVWASWMTVASNSTFAASAPVIRQLPTLGLAASAGGLVLSWPASGVGYALYTTTNLIPPAGWSLATNAPALVNDRWQISLPQDGSAACFCRLQAQ